MKKNKKALFGLAALAAVAAIGGTWAYWSQDLTAVNEFQTGKYDSDIVEEFIPPTPGEWVPGVTVPKEVTVKNSGNVKLAAIAAIDQVWVRTESVEAENNGENETVSPAEGEYFDLMFRDDKDELQYASIISWGEDIVVLSAKGTETAVLAAKTLKIDTQVTSLDSADAAGKWILVDAQNSDEVNKGEGFSNLKFVYNGIIGEGGESPKLLTGATLNPLINTTVTEKTTTVRTDEEGNTIKTTETKTNPAYGYDSAKYTMTINATTVQATEDAINTTLEAKGYSKQLATEFITANKDELLKTES